ncbi:MAG: efflux RND transporter periplasmic adaptor subunit [Planctomycetota bacterium]
MNLQRIKLGQTSAKATNPWALAFAISLGCNRPAIVKTKDKQEEPAAVQLVTVSSMQTSRTTTQPATVHAYFEAAIRSRVEGYVENVLVDIGDVVSEGQPLAKVDAPELSKRAEVLKAKIGLLLTEELAAKAQVDLTAATVDSARAMVTKAQSEKAEVDASLAAAEAELGRTQDLVDRGSLQKRMLDEATKKRDMQIAARRAVDSSVVAARADVKVASANNAAAKVRVQIAEANTSVAEKQLEELNVLLDFATLAAPFDGVISKRSVEPGDLVEGPKSSKSHPLFVVSKVDKVRIRVLVPEADSPFVEPDDTMTIRFPSFENEPVLKARVTRRSGTLDPSTRSMTIEADVENQDGKLLPGMFGEATIELDTNVAMNVLPSRSIRFDAEGNSFVYIIDGENRVRKSDVLIGMDNGTQIQVISGLAEGDRVIGPHLKRFADGQLIRPL